MATDIKGSDQLALASDQLKPEQKGFGQNCYGGASSDLPGMNTETGFAKTNDPIRDTLSSPARGKSALQDDSGTGNPVADLVRKSGDNPLPPAHGMKNPKTETPMGKPARPVTTRG